MRPLLNIDFVLQTARRLNFLQIFFAVVASHILLAIFYIFIHYLKTGRFFFIDVYRHFLW